MVHLGTTLSDFRSLRKRVNKFNGFDRATIDSLLSANGLSGVSLAERWAEPNIVDCLWNWKPILNPGGITASSSTPHINVSIMKISTACLQCRTGKRKCRSVRIGDSCNPCIRKSLPCSNRSSRRRYQPHDNSLIPAPCDNIQPPYSDEVIYLVDLYFDYIHDKPHTLFHEPSFKASVVDGTVSRTVLLCIIGLSAR